MPIYAYRCAECGFQKDVLQKLSDAALTVCPTCGAASFSKQLSAPAFQLKGTGWYVTDFRDNGKTAEAERMDRRPRRKETAPRVATASSPSRVRPAPASRQVMDLRLAVLQVTGRPGTGRPGPPRRSRTRNRRRPPLP